MPAHAMSPFYVLKLNLPLASNCKSHNNLTELGYDVAFEVSCRKLAFKVSKLARLSKTLPKEILIKIYNSMIQPCMIMYYQFGEIPISIILTKFNGCKIMLQELLRIISIM
jgi:hypothetical protein